MKHSTAISILALGAALAGGPAALATALPDGAAPAAATQQVGFEVFLPLRNKAELTRLLAAQQNPAAPEYHKWLTPTEFAARFGPTPASIAKVRAALGAQGLTTTLNGSRALKVSGSAFQVNTAFRAQLRNAPTPDGKTRLVAGARMVLPTALQQAGAKIVGLESVAHRQPMSMKLDGAIPDNRSSPVGVYWFTDLKQAYDYPSYLSKIDGTGVKAAVLMSDLLFPNDVQAIFDHENFTKVTHKAAPRVSTVLVDGGGVINGGGSFEASLDVQQITGGAPGASVTLVSIPDLSNQSVFDGYLTIVESNAYDVVNSSFGLCELEYTADFNGGTDFTFLLTLENEIFQQGNAQGITFVASSGDQAGNMCPGANYGPGKSARFIRGVSSPADDPNVTAVGGGNLVTFTDGSTLRSNYSRESAYADPQDPYDIYGQGGGAVVSGGNWGAGGGIGAVFPRPDYQLKTATGSSQFRTVPDVGMFVGGLGFSYLGAYCGAASCSIDDSSVRTAYAVGLGGGFYRTIGTSVSSPEFVGALALYIQKTGQRQGNINPFLYAAGNAQTKAGGVRAPTALQYYHRNIPGSNGVYPTIYPSMNYSYINGNGTPDVRKLFGLTAYPAAGVPQSPSNP